MADLAGRPSFGAVVLLTLPDDRAGRAPDLLFRPPISLVSF
jgi:hypothetical protein